MADYYIQPTVMDNPFEKSDFDHIRRTANEIREHLQDQDRVTATGFTSSTVNKEVSRELDAKIQRMEDMCKSMGLDLSNDNIVKPLKKRPAKIRRDSGYAESEMMPDDSSSVRDYNSNKRYMNDGTVVVPTTLLNANNTQLSAITSSKRGSLFDNVIGGYGLTAEEKMEEMREMTEIRSVSGLNQIFIDERLNFLIHIHKQLYKLLMDGTQYPAQDSLDRINHFIRRMKSKDRTPHEDLLYQVIRTTISSHKLKVKANPFNIPILETGMVLNPQIIFMTFKEFNMEYRTVWFNVMKDITVPDFHNTYSSKLTRVAQTISNKRKGSTVLGFSS